MVACGGDKLGQREAINLALEYLQDWRERDEP